MSRESQQNIVCQVQNGKLTFSKQAVRLIFHENNGDQSEQSLLFRPCLLCSLCLVTVLSLVGLQKESLLTAAVTDANCRLWNLGCPNMCVASSTTHGEPIQAILFSLSQSDLTGRLFVGAKKFCAEEP